MAEANFGIPIVLDIGSRIIKVGLAGDEAPKFLLSVVGHHRYNNHNYPRECIVGEASLQSYYHFQYPLNEPKNWDDCEKLMFEAFYNKLHVDPFEHPILITEPPFEKKNNREKMIEILFEYFNFHSVYSTLPGVLSIYNSGFITGMVLESGDNYSYTIPIIEGEYKPETIRTLKYAGKNVTNKMFELMSYSSDQNLQTFFQKENIYDIKEKNAYVALDYETELQTIETLSCNAKFKTDNQPDHDTIAIGKERIIGPEILFQPSIFNIEDDSIAKATFNSVMSVNDENVRNFMFKNIVLSGGNTMLTGFVERMEKEFKTLVSPNINFRFNASPDRWYNSWLGGSIFASLDSFIQKSITSSEYEEIGPAIVYKMH